MSLLPARLTQSSLGEKCASYLDTVAVNVPVSLHTLGRQLSSNLQLLKSSSAFRGLAQSLDSLGLSEQDTAIVTVLVCCFTIVVMSWRSPLSSLWRRSPYNASNPPHVSDSDYSYLTPDDIVEPRPSSRAYGQQHAGTGDTEPDTLLLKHRKDSYRLQFPAYAIDDGALSVGQLRQQAAGATHTPNPDRIKLLYKGKLLDKDSLPCKAEGLKQHSEVLCVVSEVQPGETTPSDVSDSDADKTSGSARPDRPARKNKKNKNKNKNKKKTKQADQPVDPNALAPPMAQRPSSSGRSTAPEVAPSLNSFRTALEQVDALASYFRNELLPFCDEYIAQPPTDPKARDYEHKRRSETVLAQVILKADGIDPTGDDDARNARRGLIKETQAILSRLDQAAKS
ncbi:BAG domain-containing protein [Aspergillus sp. HF37]|nr:BAG domain-containing protein [Aspergillus sp. HF37]